MSPQFTPEAAYEDRHRPVFHFTPQKNWMNDPNGLVYYGGSFHLFYQYNPFGTRWGHMHWGHAESADLLHWRSLPIALSPDPLGTIFSGSVVVDHQNSSGLFPTSREGLVAVFTYFKWGLQRQGIAISTDGGLTWQKYHKNPVIKNPCLIHFRDPKVFYHAPSKHWIMLVTVGSRIRFYRSHDLLTWMPVGYFGKGAGAHGGVWECPDLFELAVDGDRRKKRWVLLVSVKEGAPAGGSGTQYFIGDFDGERFTADDPGRVRWLDFGADNYAGITYNNVPGSDGRRIFIGWMNNWRYAQKIPSRPWRGAMTVPRHLTLTREGGQIALLAGPVGELAGIRTGGVHLANERIDGKRVMENKEFSGGAFEIIAEWQADDEVQFGISLGNSSDEETVIGFEPGARRLYIDRSRSGETGFSGAFPGVHYAPIFPENGRFKARIIVDTCSVEVFAGGGKVVMTDLVFPSAPYDRLTMYSRGGVATLLSLSGWGLRASLAG
jgi:fructan beta-fructosidase